MKKIIKTIIVVAIVSIFAFSSNPTIEKVRGVFLEKSGVLYETVIKKGSEYAEKNGNDKLQKGIEVIK